MGPGQQGSRGQDAGAIRKGGGGDTKMDSRAVAGLLWGRGTIGQVRGPGRKKGFEVLCDMWGLWLRREAWVEVLVCMSSALIRVEGEDRCPERAETRVGGSTQTSKGVHPLRGISFLPSLLTMSSPSGLPLKTTAPPCWGPRHSVLLALTFKVPLLLPPTFTLILLPNENLQEWTRERDIRGAHKGTRLFQFISSPTHSQS